MASVQTEHMPQVGVPIDRPFNPPISIPFESIRLYGRFNRLHGRDNRDAAFWTNTLVANVDGRRYLAKIYNESLGGEKAFAHDLERLVNDKGSSIPRVFGHSNDSATPCILFATSHVVPLHAHLGELSRSSPETALQDAWQLLIDMKVAAEGLLRNYPTLPSSILRDALARASVDDQCKIVLTPEVDGRPCNSQESVEKLVQTAWASFLQSEKYRPLRALGWALAGNPQAVLGKSPKTFENSEGALQYLQQFWIPPSRRYLSWPSNTRGYFEPGDIGVFEVDCGTRMVFRKLASVAPELGGLVLKLDAGDFEEIESGVFRKTYYPFSDGELINPPLDFFMMTWCSKLKNSELEWNWLRENARRLASEHSVLPEDLVLLTETVHGLDSESLESLARSIQKPIHYYIHLDTNGRALRQYWSFSGTPRELQAMSEASEDPDLKGLPFPIVNMHFGNTPFPVKYLQMELGDL